MKNILTMLWYKFTKNKILQQDTIMSKIPVIIESLCYLLLKLRKIDKIHLVKLMYLADKYHLMNYGRTITGDDFIALEHGPTGSRTMDVLEFDRYILGNYMEKAEKFFQQGNGHEYLPGEECSIDRLEMLSESDTEALDFAVSNFGTKDKWDVVKYAHTLQEWKKFEPLFKSHITKRESIATTEVLTDPHDKYFQIPKEHIEDSYKILTGSFD
ncbi:MAG: Panacea domain-containing protein [Pseudomonadota bacterium]